MGDAEADRALGGTPWRHPNPIRNRRKPEPVSGDVAWSASTATAGRLYFHFDEERDPRGRAHAYRGGVPAPTGDAHPWRSHPAVQARGWLWAAALMAAIGWMHARFPLVPSSVPSPDEGIEAISAMEAW